MKKYRIGYNQFFVTEPLSGFEYKGGIIVGIDLNFLYYYFDENGNEILFNKNDNPHKAFMCFIDKNGGYRMEQKRVDNIVAYQLYKSFIYYENYMKPYDISNKEAIEILKTNFDRFDNLNNRPTESSSYFFVSIEIKE